jgi:hypothetical protein
MGTGNAGLVHMMPPVNPIENAHSFGLRKSKATVSATGDKRAGQAVPPCRELRCVLVLPIYTLAPILDVAAAVLGRLAALVAGDDWPE